MTQWYENGPVPSPALWPVEEEVCSMCYCNYSQTLLPDGSFIPHFHPRTGEPCPPPDKTVQDRARYGPFAAQIAAKVQAAHDRDHPPGKP